MLSPPMTQRKFYQTIEFRQLQTEWKAKLAQEGFKDAEYPSGKLRDHDRRTIAFENRERIADFFRQLDDFITHSQVLSDHERTILSFYSDGKRVREICKLVDRSYTHVRNIIRKYRPPK